MIKEINELDELRKLTEKLPAVPKLQDLVNHREELFLEYKIEGEGETSAHALINSKDVCVQNLYISKGTHFDEHVHKDKIEFAILYKGNIKITHEDGSIVTLNVGDSVRLEKGEPHSADAVEDSWLITMTIPGDREGYAK